jgi:hypothetical protein
MKKMKKAILWILDALPATGFAREGKLVLTGQVGVASAPAQAYCIRFNEDGTRLVDSCVLNKGKFSFEANITGPVNAAICIDHKGTGLNSQGDDADILYFYLEKGNLAVTAKDSVKGIAG